MTAATRPPGSHIAPLLLLLGAAGAALAQPTAPPRPEPTAAQDPADGGTPPTLQEPPSCAQGLRWPGEGWSKTPAAAGAVAALEAYAFAPPPEGDRAGVRTDGIVIVHDGQLVYERYARGYTAQMPHLSWSVSKTFTNALIGLAVSAGKLDLEDSVCDHLEVERKESCQIQVQHLLEMASGLDWRETYEGESPAASAVLQMLYGDGQQDMAAFVLDHPLRDPPGSSFQYSSGDSNVLSAVARSALSAEHGEDYAWDLLFGPLGMETVSWERDGAGTPVGSSYLYASPRDLARFGLLWLRDGCWEGERLLPEGWVEASTRVSEPVRSKPLGLGPGEPVQGRQVWLNQPVPEQGWNELPWPSAPADAFAALGHWKQSITVLPSRDLVIVRVADDRDGSYDHDRFLALAMALAPPEEAP